MNPNDKADKAHFAALITKKMVIYKEKLNSCLLQEYWQALQAYPLSELERAWDAHICDPDHGQFPPKPADLIRHISGSHQTQARLAWAKVIAAIKQIGSYSSVTFDDPLIHAVLKTMGGWVQLCASTYYELAQHAQTFQCHYSDLLKNRPPDYPRLLHGLHQSDKPILIGDQRRAYQVMMCVENTAMVTHRKKSVKPPSNQ
ncbi:MAG: DUF6475 domain-containing protein [Gammaproteobacteria bacterium]